MKRKKIFLLQLMAVFLLSAFFGLTAAAESGAAVATIGSENYASLEEAVKKVQNAETIVLKKNVAYDQKLQLNTKKTYTLDLNNKKVAFGKDAGLLVKKGNVTIVNAQVTQKDTKGTAIEVSKGATLNIEGGTYKGKISNAGVLNISGGQFISLEKQTDLTSALIMNNGKMTVSGGTFDGKKNTVLENHKKVDIQGGTFKNAMSQVAEDVHENGQLIANLEKGTTLKITGGNFNAGTQCLLNGDGATLTIKEGKSGCTFSSKRFCTLLNCGVATINGGTYISKLDWPVVWTEGGVAKTTIKDGTFTSEWTMLEAYSEGKVDVSGGKFTSKSPKDPTIAMILAFNGKINVTGGTFKASNIGLYWYERDPEIEAKVTIAKKVLDTAKTKGKEITR